MRSTPRYEFRFAEPLSAALCEAFPGLRVAEPGRGDVLYGPVTSQDELGALVSRFATMRLTLLDVRRLPD